ncbi:MAG: site-specific integrase [Nitrososphaeria archaeon]|jgi:integrase
MDRIGKFLELYSSKYTRSSYQLSLKHFFNFIYQEGNLSLNDQGEKYFTEKRNYEEDIEKFSQSINSKPPKTIRLMLSTVKTFFIENDIELSDKFWKRTRRRIKGSRALTLDKVPSNEELKKILSHMSIEGKALFLVLSSSGMRIGESLKLKLSDLEDGTPYKVKIRGEYTKSGNSRITFISKESVLFLNEWLKVRQNHLNSENGKTRLHASKEDERIFPYRVQTAYYMWRNALTQSGYMKRDSSTNRMTIHPHVLRKFYRTRLGSIIPVDIVETLMGHEGYLTEVYRKYQDDPDALGKFYMQGEHTLTVFGSGEDVNKLREEISEKNKELQTLVNSLATENISLRNRLEVVEKEISKISEIEKIVKELQQKRLEVN